MASVRDWISNRFGGEENGGSAAGAIGGVAGSAVAGPIGGIAGRYLGNRFFGGQAEVPGPNTTADQDFASLPGNLAGGLDTGGGFFSGIGDFFSGSGSGSPGPVGGGLPSNSFTINDPGSIPGGFDLGNFLGGGSGGGIGGIPGIPTTGGGGGSVPGTPPIVDIPTTPSGPSDNPVQFFFDQPENGYYLSDDGRESILSNRGPGSSPVDNTFRKLGLGGEATIGGYPPSADGPFKSVAPPGNPWNLPNPGGHVPTPGVGLNPWPGLLDFTGGS